MIDINNRKRNNRGAQDDRYYYTSTYSGNPSSGKDNVKSKGIRGAEYFLFDIPVESFWRIL